MVIGFDQLVDNFDGPDDFPWLTREASLIVRWLRARQLHEDFPGIGNGEQVFDSPAAKAHTGRADARA
ncbi:hypothetical protein [Halofilum ochraceum]|uniref:hypothetical protein n=1 Tax=Halofilum ochraceum TaxID=1611323 RepID=UPI0011130B07|nr:hypothetical protein [Halofilum ochraceum]